MILETYLKEQLISQGKKDKKNKLIENKITLRPKNISNSNHL